jgi:hypothetical protein
MTTVRSGATRLLVILTVLFAGATPAPAQQAPPENDARRSMTAFRLADGESIELDGRLDEAVWSKVTPAADFIQVDPANGRPATEPTEVRIAYDNDSLYMGVTAYDSEPDRWLGFQRRRDQGLGSDDRFMWTIDTFLDGRTGYFFEMNPSGLIADALIGITGDNRQWDGIWDGKARRSEIGWTLEIEIPFRTLNFNPNSDTWGINFQRTVRRKNEESIWNGWARNQGLRRMNNAGLVTGIRNASQGRGLDIKPYGLFTSEASPGRGRTSMIGKGNAGVDLFYNPTPLMRANLTINTDFAQTEVDQRQVNLTRYSLFFPERRDFFLDGAPFFDFGSPTDSDLRVNPFFSRRIGLSSAGLPQKIDFGTKITGQVGAQDVGLLHVRVGEDDGLAGEDFTVARVKRRLLRQSYVGALYTRRDPRVAGGDTSHTAGFDGTFATSQFLGSQNLQTGGWLLHVTDPGPGVSGGSSAFGGHVDYPNDLWSARLDATEVQERFNPRVGFVTRQNYRRYTPIVTFAPRPNNHPRIRQFEFSAQTDVLTDLHNELIARNTNVTLLRVNLHTQDNFSLSTTRNYERLDAPFDISRGITLPIGAEYTFTRYRIQGQTANRRKLAFNGSYEAGDFYSGTRTERVVNLTVRARPGYILYLTGEWNNIVLPEGRFSTRLYRITGETQFTPYIALVNNIQYDTQSGVVGWQARFRWIVTPGNDLYVVYTHNWLDEPLLDRFATLDKRFASKILYTYRF